MDRLMLLDTASLYFRAFYGVPESVTDAHGNPVNAVRGLLDAISRLVTDSAPQRLIACWDDDWRPAWRVELVRSYKAHRLADPEAGLEETPAALLPQIPVIREMLDLLGVPVVGAAGCEADDVIGTLVARAESDVDVVTGDRDLFQLIDDARGVRVISTIKGMRNLETISDATVRERYGVAAAQYADFATLRGDSSDGLPGVAGVGEKTAAGLLAEYGDLAGIRAAASDPSTTMSAGIRAKIAAAADYLDVAPRVVAVLRDAELPGVGDDRIRPLEGERADRFAAFADAHGLGGAADRIRAALARA